VAPAGGPPLRTLAASVYLPTLLFAIGQGAVLPVIALAAREEGASVAVAGFVAALPWIATMLFDLPASSLVARLGDGRAISVGTGLLLVSLAGCAWRPSVAAYGMSALVLGCAWSIWLLARFAYVSGVMPIHVRGRAMSSLGGVNRIGLFVGPFLGAGLVTVAGLNGAFLVHALSGLAAWATIMATSATDEQPGHGTSIAPSLGAVLRTHAATFATAGVAVMIVAALRASRQLLLPLWGDHLGLEGATIGVVFGLSSAMDMTLFYPAGAAMDRWGRKAVGLPCLTILALGLILLPLAGTTRSLIGVGLLLGFGNGIGSGVIMTLGSDLAPAAGRAQFLGAWRLVGDLGTAAGPLLIAALGAMASLGAGSVVIGVLGLAGVPFFAYAVPETYRRQRPRRHPPDSQQREQGP
jgi:MFS family permease